MKPIVTLTLIFLLTPTSALAYIDPGSGSYLIQVLIGLAAGVLWSVRSFLSECWTKFRNLFKK
jgi:hypothetical protein